MSVYSVSELSHAWFSGSFHVLTELWSGTEEGFAKSLKQHSLKSLWEPAEALDRLKIKTSVGAVTFMK
ncbi:Hypothetical predicted protein [Podarcis lilfordi]|uniref:Uncharacterized protein n=1 Tax=Podarcis lilfordi TaxID=74358 RepID=A0AA35KV03_9SAUR|nr:Hypothetical predicted protein [Podarcis lilfordi]